MIYKFWKRTFDLGVAILLLVILSPLILLVAIFIKGGSAGPIFYIGKRAGIRGVPFWMYKFRTMVSDAELMGGYSTALNDPRLTSCGRFLRKYKIDELPQLFNVLKGEMSLVGPRPQVFYYTDKYDDHQKKILFFKPGITDLASLYFADMDAVLGSNNVDQKYESEIEPKKNELRLLYISKASFTFDIKILFLTFAKLLRLNLTSNF